MKKTEWKQRLRRGDKKKKELYQNKKKKKGFNDLHNHDDVVNQLEVDILEWSHVGLRKRS